MQVLGIRFRAPSRNPELLDRLDEPLEGVPLVEHGTPELGALLDEVPVAGHDHHSQARMELLEEEGQPGRLVQRAFPVEYHDAMLPAADDLEQAGGARLDDGEPAPREEEPGHSLEGRVIRSHKYLHRHHDATVEPGKEPKRRAARFGLDHRRGGAHPSARIVWRARAKGGP